jgi:4-aminobutyrate aminotransferase
MKKSLSEKIVQRDHQVVSPSYTRLYPLVVNHGSKANIWDVDNRKYIDFTSGIAVANVGHANPEVVKAIKLQADKILHHAGTDFYSELQVRAAEELIKITPGNFKKRVFFTNSGTESVECAFKLSRWFKKRPRIIAFLGAFHGRTYGSMTLSASKLIQREHFSPLVPGVTHSPYPYCYRCPFDQERNECDYECLQYLENEILKKIAPPEEVASIIVEPVQGEEGYIVPPKDFHKRLKKICRDYDFLYVADEIQTGFARSGRMFASQYFGVQPDIICLAKAIAGGLPMGACVSRRNIMVWPPGSHASTFSGNPVACAASLETIKYIKKHKLWKNSEKLGRFGLRYLRELKERNKHIGDARGLGLMIGIEIVKDKRSKKPDYKTYNKILTKCFQKGLLLLGSGTSTIRIAPPLVIEREEFEEGLGILKEVVSKMK